MTPIQGLRILMALLCAGTAIGLVVKKRAEWGWFLFVLERPDPEVKKP